MPCGALQVSEHMKDNPRVSHGHNLSKTRIFAAVPMGGKVNVFDGTGLVEKLRNSREGGDGRG